MEIEIIIEKKDGYILVQYQGPDSAEISKEIAVRTLASCEEYACYKILTLASLDNNLSTMENYDLAEMFEEIGVPKGTMWAWVDLNPAIADSSDFGAWVLRNKGYQIKAFTNERQALAWLHE